jgi:hypothetical protein
MRITHLRPGLALLPALGLCAACAEGPIDFDPAHPARGPSEMIEDNQPITDGNFPGGSDTIPAARSDVAPPEDGVLSCDGACRSYCEAAGLQNPVNAGVCSSLWGQGIEGTPIVDTEACRRLWVDTQGVFPTHKEINQQCLGRPWGDVVHDLISTDAFVTHNRQLWADRLHYDTTSVSVERVYDMDLVVKAAYEGRISYDQFAAILSAHPVLTRRFDNEGDRVESLFWLLLGRPPFGQERSDLGRLYHLWHNGYYDHPGLGMRLPDAFIGYRCLDWLGDVDQATSGECTSVLYGFQQLILKPDARAYRNDDGNMEMWSGVLRAEEWKKLQAPGRLLAEQWLFWEHAANVVIDQYLGYNLATMAPEVGERLAQYAIENQGDIRALHFAVLTSYPYLASAMGGSDTALRYTYGPVKQVEAEGWVDSLTKMTGSGLDKCDLRMNRPDQFLEAGTPASIALVRDSDWKMNDDYSGVKDDYRSLVQTLGGCPDNSQGGRFKIVSVFTTAAQLNYAGQVCAPSPPPDDGNGDRRQRQDRAAPIDDLLPGSVSANDALTPEMAQSIIDFQARTFFARPATQVEIDNAGTYAGQCTGCNAEQFARPACFALLSSSEMIFY